MRTWIITALTALVLTASSTVVCASGCNTNTIFQGGRAIVCTTCCVAGNCNTVCSP